jgi:hypothetical protein
VAQPCKTPEHTLEWHRKYRARKAAERREHLAREAAARLGRPPQSLGEWFSTQSTFRNWAELAASVGVSPEHLCRLRDGKHEPTDRVRRRLLEITGLPCFEVGANLPLWARELLTQAQGHVNSLPLRHSTAQWYVALMRSSVARLVAEGLTSAKEITPAVLLQNPPRFS